MCVLSNKKIVVGSWLDFPWLLAGQKKFDICRIRTYAGEAQEISNLTP
jgi:hypothetical protein